MADEEKTSALKKLLLTVQVVGLSGKGIRDAKVEVKWDHITAASRAVVTDDTGTAIAPFVEPQSVASGGPFPGSVNVSKPHHGPIVSGNDAFKHAAASVRLEYRPGATAPFSITGLPAASAVRWGRPRIIGPTGSILEITLLEGGTHGNRDHSAIRTRRLSAPHLPRSNPPEKISEVHAELLRHMARGDLALEVDFKFKHAGCPDFGDCLPACEIDLPATTGGGTPKVPKVSVRNNVAGGLRVLQLLQFSEKSTPGYKVGNTSMAGLNPRLVVGVVRLCKLLQTKGVSVLLSTGFLRSGELRYHGTGRAIDFSGLMIDHPSPLKDPVNTTIVDPLDPHCSLFEKTKVTKKDDKGKVVEKDGVPVLLTTTGFTRTKSVELKDLIVLLHWGTVQLLVKKRDGTVERQSERGKNFKEGFNTADNASEQLLYRFAELPTASERKGEAMSDDHYKLTGELFLLVYEFFAKEFTHRNLHSELGPLPPLGDIPKDRTTGNPKPTAAQKKIAQAMVDDGESVPAEVGTFTAASRVPGEVGGYTLHPDFPLSSKGSDAKRREDHANHIHANLGASSAGPGYEL